MLARDQSLVSVPLTLFDEIHFLFSCALYDSISTKFLNEITDKFSIFNEYDINAKNLLLCNSIGPTVCRLTAAFVFHAMTLRHETFFSK